MEGRRNVGNRTKEEVERIEEREISLKAGNWSPIINVDDAELGKDLYRDWNNQLCHSDALIIRYSTDRLESVRRVFDIGKSRNFFF